MVTDAKYFDDFIGMDQWTNGVAKVKSLLIPASPVIRRVWLMA
jgi:hypothetical protein